MNYLKWSLILLLLFLSAHLSAQNIYFTKNGHIAFFSKAPLENIEAHNNEVASFIDVDKNQIAFSVLIKGFRFEKALMEEHFNANYMHSNKFSKATFIGKVVNTEDIQLGVDGTYQAKVEGTMTIHNVSNKVNMSAVVGIQNKQIVSGKAKFTIRLADYQVKIPSVVSQNIAETVEIRVDCKYLPLENKK